MSSLLATRLETAEKLFISERKRSECMRHPDSRTPHRKNRRDRARRHPDGPPSRRRRLGVPDNPSPGRSAGEDPAATRRRVSSGRRVSRPDVASARIGRRRVAPSGSTVALRSGQLGPKVRQSFPEDHILLQVCVQIRGPGFFLATGWLGHTKIHLGFFN